MQSRNPFFDDLARLMTSAAGVAQNAKSEMETVISSNLERWLADRNFVTREEFNAVRTMAIESKDSNAVLLDRIKDLEKRLKALESEKTKSVRSKSKNS